MKKLLFFLFNVMLIGAISAQSDPCISLNPANVNAIAGTSNVFSVTFANSGLVNANKYALHYRILYDGELIPNDSLRLYIDLDTCNISTNVSGTWRSGAHITTSDNYFPNGVLPLGYDISDYSLNFFNGQYLNHSSVHIDFYLRWLRSGDYTIELELYEMNNGTVQTMLSYKPAKCKIGGYGAQVGALVLSDEIVTTKHLPDTVIYKCFTDIPVTYGDFTWTADGGWSQPDVSGNCFWRHDDVNFITSVGACQNNRLDSVQTITVVRYPDLSATIAASGNNATICQQTTAGYYVINVSGGRAPYSIQPMKNGEPYGDPIASEGSSASITVDGLSAGEYTFVVTDANGCTATPEGTALVEDAEEDNVFSVGTQSVTHVACYGFATGAIDVTLTETSTQATSYTYAWSGPDDYTANTLDITGLTAGDYNLTVTDNMGCTATLGPVSISEGEVIATQTAASCCVNELPYHFDPQHADTVFYASDIVDGQAVKVVKYQSVNQCDSLVTVTLTVYENPTPEISGDTLVCRNGELTLVTESNMSNYEWDYTDATLLSDNATSNSIKLSWAAGGTYTVSVAYTDENNCSSVEPVTHTVRVLAPAVELNTITAPTICPGESVQLAASYNPQTTVGDVTYLWSNDSTTATNTVAPSETTECTVTATATEAVANTNVSCSVNATQTVTVTVNTPTLALNDIAGNDAICFAGNTTLTASAESNGDVTYKWNTGATTDAITVEPTADSTFTVTATATKVVDNVSCSVTATESVDVTVHALPQPTLANASVCATTNDFATSLEISTTTGMSDYDWDLAGATVTGTGATVTAAWATPGAKNISVTVTDEHNCEATANAVITVDTIPVVAISSEDLSICVGQQNTTLTASEGSDYSYAWSNQGDARSIEVSAAGIYTVIVTNGNGCQAQTSATVTENTLPTVAISSSDEDRALCPGQGNTVLTATITPGTATIDNATYNWGDSTTRTKTVDVADTYTVTIIDDEGCSASGEIEITENTLPTVAISGATTFCANASTTLTADVTNGTDVMTYVWNNQVNTQDNTVNEAGEYSVIVTDAHGCTATANVTVSVNAPAIALNDIAGETTICKDGETTLTASTVADGTNGTVTYAWNTQATDADITVSPVENTEYTVTATATVNTNDVVCTATATKSVTVTVNAPAVTLANIADVTICKDDETTLTASTVADGTNGTVTYVWNTQATDDAITVSPDATTTYTVTATATVNTNEVVCTATDSKSVTVTVNPLVELSATGDTTQTVCAGTAIAPFTIQYANATVEVAGLPTGITYNQVNNTISGSCAAAGTYHYTVTATSNQQPACSAEVLHGTITVNALPTVVISETSKTICAGTTYTIEPTYTGQATLTYQWYKGNEELPDVTSANLADIAEAGTYHVVVTDGNTPACSAQSEEVTISVNTLPIVVVSTTAGGSAVATASTCKGEEITLYAVSTSSASARQWYKGDVAINGATGATLVIPATEVETASYYVMLTDEQTPNCSATSEPIAVTVNDLPQPTLANDLAVCASSTDFPTEIEISTIADMSNYVWSLPTATVTGSGNTITASWTGYGTQTAAVTVTDANGCVGTANTVVTVRALPTATITSDDLSICSGSTATLTAPEGSDYSYAWSNQGNTRSIEVSAADTYTVTVTDGDGCKAKASATVTVNTLPTVAISSSDEDRALCPGQGNTVLTATITPGTATIENATYNWGDSTTRTKTVATAGTYHVTITDDEGCTATNSITIAENTLPTVAISGDDAFCEDASTTLTANVTGGTAGTENMTYAWSNQGNTQTNTVTSAGEYTVTVTDAQGCYATATQTVSVNSLPEVQINADVPAAVCMGTQVDITLVTSDNVASYTWKKGDAIVGNESHYSFTANGDSTYTVIVATANGCTASATYTGTAYALPTITTVTPTDLRCNGDQSGKIDLVVSGQSPWIFAWSGPDEYTSADQNLTGLAAGSYTVTATDAHGCEVVSEPVEVGQPDELTVTAAAEEEVCVGTQVTLTAEAAGGTAGYTYVWKEGEAILNSTQVAPSTTTTYTVEATDANGCTSTDEVTVTVNALPVIASFTAPTDCPYSENFNITANVTSGTPTYDYTWSGAVASNTPGTAIVAETTPVAATRNYSVAVTVTDSKGCQANRDTTFTIADQTVPVITGAIADHNMEGCSGDLANSYPAKESVSELENTFGLAISDNCTADADLTVSYEDLSAGTCPIVVTRTYTVTDKCGNATQIAQTINVNVADNITVTGGTNAKTVDCLADTVAPHTLTPSVMPVVTDACGNTLNYVSVVGSTPEDCGTTKTFTYTYKDCANHEKSWVFTYTISQPFSAGAIVAGEETICSGGDASEIGSATDATGCTEITYLWQQSTDNASWSDITGANNATYTPTGLTQTTYFRRAAQDECHALALSTGLYKVNVNADITITDQTENGSVCPDGSYEMSVTAEGGIGTLTYQWYAGDQVIDNATNSSYTAENIAAAIAFKCVVSGTAASGCAPAEASIEVGLYTLPTITLDDATLCLNGTKALTPSGAVTYEWAGEYLSDEAGASVTFTGESAGTYTITVTGTDEHGCENTATATVKVNTLPTTGLQLSNATICLDGTQAFSVDAQQGTTYTWTVNNDGILTETEGPSTMFSAEAANQYTVTVNAVDGNQCESSASATVTVNALPTVELSEEDFVCYGSNYTIEPDYGDVESDGQLSYAWYNRDVLMPNDVNANLTLTNVTEEDIYYVVVTDGQTGCSSKSDNFTIRVNALPTVTLPADETVICAGETATLTATASEGVSYAWKHNNEPISGSSSTLQVSDAGKYVVEVTDGNECVGHSDTVTVTVNALPTVTMPDDVTICAGNDYTITPTYGESDNQLTYTWYADEEEIDASSATLELTDITDGATYYVVVTDAETNCSTTSTEFDITVNTASTVTITEDYDLDVICADSAFHFTATAGMASYTWKRNNVEIEGVSGNTLRTQLAGRYVVDFVSQNECVGHSDTVPVTVNALPGITAEAEPDAVCIGDNTTLLANGAGDNGTYVWSNDDQGIETEVTPTADVNTYTVTGTNVHGCSNTATVTVTVNPLPIVTVMANPTSVCDGTETTLTAAGAETYEWSHNADATGAEVSATPTANAHTFTVTGTDANGCSNTAEVVVNVIALPVVNVNATNVSCGELGSVTIEVTSGQTPYTCAWNNADATALDGDTYEVSDLEEGTYPYVITDGNGCSTTGDAVVDAPGAITAVQTIANATSCEGVDNNLSVAINGGTAPYTCTWVNADNEEVLRDTAEVGNTFNINMNTLSDGDYRLTMIIEDQFGCGGGSDTIDVAVMKSYNIVREINLATGVETYTYNGAEYTLPNVPETENLHTAQGCDSIITYEVHQYDLEILIADTCTMTRSTYSAAYANTPHTLYGDTIYVSRNVPSTFYVYVSNTTSEAWNEHHVDMTYALTFNEDEISDDSFGEYVNAMKIATYLDRDLRYFGRDSVDVAVGEIPSTTFMYQANLNSVIKYFDFFYFDAFKNVPNKVDFTFLQNGTYTFKFKLEDRNATGGTNVPGIYNPYIVNRRYGHLLGGTNDEVGEKEVIAARTFTVIVNEDGVNPSAPAPTAVADYSEQAVVSTYPNPVRDLLNVNVSGFEGETTITVTDAQGKVVRVISENLAGGQQVLTYNVSGFAQGIYFINVRNNEKTISQKFVVNK